MAQEASSIPLYSIGTAARLLGISVPTLRMYERKGLIIPYKAETGQRRYSERDVERIRCVRSAINDDKVSIEGIRRILALVPCWAIINCRIADREQCQAFRGHSSPCWDVNRKGPHCRKRSCRECPVYTSHHECGAIKAELKKLTITR